jgi:hypothetical protein
MVRFLISINIDIAGFDSRSVSTLLLQGSILDQYEHYYYRARFSISINIITAGFDSRSVTTLLLQGSILNQYQHYYFRVRFSINLRNVLGVDEIGERISIETTIRSIEITEKCSGISQIWIRVWVIESEFFLLRDSDNRGHIT